LKIGQGISWVDVCECGMHFAAATLATPSKVNSNDWVEFSGTETVAQPYSTDKRSKTDN